jgi:hypothetical protein
MKSPVPASSVTTPSQLYRPFGESVQVFDMSQIPWQVTGNKGLSLKPVRHDDKAGSFLGLVKFDAFARSGLHQHQGLATSFVIDGGLTDYHGSIKLHEAGLNFKGATHDAIAYQNTVLVSRLEAAVSYPPNSNMSGVHAGSRYQEFVNPNPGLPPEINVPVDALAAKGTGYQGVTRQTIYDYTGLDYAGRYVQLTLKPHTLIEFESASTLEFWVRGGNLSVNNIDAHANCFVVCKEKTKISMASPFGALLICWVHEPEIGCTKSDQHSKDLFGFL